jgi:hypothetical protein
MKQIMQWLRAGDRWQARMQRRNMLQKMQLPPATLLLHNAYSANAAMLWKWQDDDRLQHPCSLFVLMSCACSLC